MNQNCARFTKQFKMVELADTICKLLNDSNAKIQLQTLENLNKIFGSISGFIETFIQLFYKALITNLGASNIGVRKNSDILLKQINEMLNEKAVLIQPLVNMI